jgi:uncharacterized protein (TIRG00374 family)
MILRKPSTWLTLIIGLLISALGIALVARSIDLDQLQRALNTAQYEWAILGTLCIASTIYVRTKRWQVLLRPISLHGSTLAAAMLIGQLLNFLLPIRAGDVIRAILASRSSSLSFERTLGSVAIEKAWDWITVTCVLLAATLIAPLPVSFIAPARGVGLIALIVVIIFVIIALLSDEAWHRFEPRLLMLIDRAFSWLPHRIRFAFLERLHHLLDSLETLRDRQIIWRAAAWSALTWGLGIAANVLIMRAFNIDSLPAAMLLLAALTIGTALPPSIAALGIFEGLAILTLGSFGVANETALAIGLVLHVAIFLPAVIVGSITIVVEMRAGRSVAFSSNT